MRKSLIMLLFALISCIWAQTVFAMEKQKYNDQGMETEAETEAGAKTLTIQISPENFSDKGNVKLSLGREEIQRAGYSFGDMLAVKIGDQTIDLPYGSSYSDVDSGCPALICRDQDDRARLTVNMGNFVAEYLQGVRDEEKGEWNFPKETTWPLTVTISMKEKGGYYDEYLLHRLSYTNERNDYPNLTDEEFGNFREVTTTGMGNGTLYRCSSPIDPKIGRNLYVDQALRDDERYEIIADSNIRKSLGNLFGVSDLESADLSKCVEEYLAGIGMSQDDIEALKNNLSVDAETLSLAA